MRRPARRGATGQPDATQQKLDDPRRGETYAATSASARKRLTDRSECSTSSVTLGTPLSSAKVIVFGQYSGGILFLRRQPLAVSYFTP
jgi:hypothetical protein